MVAKLSKTKAAAVACAILNALKGKTHLPESQQDSR
jgi:hypothetical protein